MKRLPVSLSQKTMRMIMFTILLLPIYVTAGESPFDGTWKLDLGDSQFPEQAEFLLQNGIFQRMAPKPQYQVKADGTDQPLTAETTMLADTVAVKILDKNTVQITGKREGRIVHTETITVSSDGRTYLGDQTEYYPNSPQPATWRYSMNRINQGPAGSHAISGTWILKEDEVNASDNALTATFKSTPNGMMFTSAIGESCDAKFDGKYYPIEGGVPGVSMSMTKENERSIIMNYKRDGKIFQVIHSTVSPDGKTITSKVENKVQGTTRTYTAIKQ